MLMSLATFLVTLCILLQELLHPHKHTSITHKHNIKIEYIYIVNFDNKIERTRIKQGQIPDLKFCKTYVCQRRLKLSKTLDIWSTTARTVPGLIRTLPIISATTPANQKLFLKIKKKALFLEVINKHVIYKFSYNLLTTDRGLAGW